MLPDKILALIASSVIKRGYNNNNLNYNSNGYYIETIFKQGHINIVQISKNNLNTYMLCQEGSQNTSDYLTDLEAMNDSRKKKVKNYKGKVTKTMWDEYTKYRHYYENFVNNFKDEGTIVFAGHSLGGAVAGIAGGMFNVKTILLAPVPFMAHSNWSKNYSTHPVSYVNPTDPCCSDRIGINWKAGNHIGKQWIYNGTGNDSHKISSFVDYFEDQVNFSIL